VKKDGIKLGMFLVRILLFGRGFAMDLERLVNYFLNPIPNCKLPLQTFLVSLGTLILSLLDLMLLNERPLLGH